MSNPPNVWMVRGGREPDRIFEKYAIDHGFTIIGWRLPDLTSIPISEHKALEELKKLFRIENPEETNNHRLGRYAGEIYRFLQIRKDDVIVMPMKSEVAIGEVIGNYRYEDRYLNESEKWPKGWHPHEGRHRIPVDWKLKSISRKELEEDIRLFIDEKYKRFTVAQFKGSSAQALRQIVRDSARSRIGSSQKQGGIPYRETDRPEANKKQSVWEIDPDRKDRGTAAHWDLQNELKEAVRSAGLEPRSPERPNPDPEFDVAWQQGDTAFVAEVKSLTEDNEVRQLRLGLGQVLNYAHLLKWPGVENVRPVLAVEHRPAAEYWVDLCKKHDVILTWPDQFGELFD